MTSQLGLSQGARLQPRPPAPHWQEGRVGLRDQLPGGEAGAVQGAGQGGEGGQGGTLLTTRGRLQEARQVGRECLGRRGDRGLEYYLIIIIRTSEINQQHLVLQ